MNHYRSNGKLLLTAEYLVLDGAKALAIPTRYGQDLTAKSIPEPLLYWRSYDHQNKCWFSATFCTKTHRFDNDSKEAKMLGKLLLEAKKLNPKFLRSDAGYALTTNMDFPKNWGLGSSSSLINNLAQWAKIDAYQLLWNSFSGSGYDIACAQHQKPILYSVKNRTVEVQEITFSPPFLDALYFVYLNRKQDSQQAISFYKKIAKKRIPKLKKEVSEITEALLACKHLASFENLINQHELLLSNLLERPTVKEQFFSDYPQSIKSLGAWGGDFVLVTADKNPAKYFENRGYQTIIPYRKMAL